MKTSVALIGFMGTGKSAVGRLLADKLGKTFIDLDMEIEQADRKPVAAIFKEDGEPRFRELEAQAAAGHAGQKNVVIACGGGIVLNNGNIFNLKQECVIVCLLATLPDILKRTAGPDRPLLNVPDREKEIQKLLTSRRPLYEKAADITIDTAGIDAPGVVKKILNALSSYESIDK
jgi:shikimate kinase